MEFIVRDTASDKVLQAGDDIVDFRGEAAMFVGCYHPRKILVAIGSHGFEAEYYPSVFGLTINKEEK